MMVNTGLNNLGQGFIITSLCLHVVSFCLFILTVYVFQKRMRRAPTAEAFDIAIPWRQHLYSLYTISGLVLVRSIFRVVEYAMGNDGYPLSNEWTLYVFDSVPMFAAMVIFAVWYSSDLKPFLDKASEGSETIESKA